MFSITLGVRRIARENPPNRFWAREVELEIPAPPADLVVLEDASRSIVAENNSPDVGFRYSVNPYRGCLHGCAYCYARPSHEYLGFGTGSDFERKILVKPRAPELLRAAFEKRSWRGELVVVSGNTDAYQPLEAEYRLTRGCLEVMAEYRNPTHIITKAALVERDIDVLQELHTHALVGISVSIPFWDASIARAIEPLTPTPLRRLETVRRLARAGLRVTVNVAPVIPGLGDRDIPKILEAAAGAGASGAAFIMLRLPGSVKQVFETRLRRELPLSADRVMSRTREVRDGQLNDPRFGARMRGTGQYADAIRELFEKAAARFGLNTLAPVSDAEATFRRPTDRGGQLRLFD
jgi:DNA repair photolyase